MNKYYQLTQNGNQVDIQIYGDITSFPWFEGDMSGVLLSEQIKDLECDQINVYINSYGGEVAEGLSIYNQLKRHKAKVVTVCDGFACSAASVVFMAGDERIMSNASLLMIHNAWTSASGNANELRKVAEDLEKITQASINAYMEHINISEEELVELLDNESWLTPQESVEMGFATSIVEEQQQVANQSVKQGLINMIVKNRVVADKEPIKDDDDNSVNDDKVEPPVDKGGEEPPVNEGGENDDIKQGTESNVMGSFLNLFK